MNSFFRLINLLIIAFFTLTTIQCFAQTGLYTYNGGYFIQDGKTWTEYRPNDKDGIWATYTQYNEEENFYNIKSSVSTVSVPKKSSNNFYIYNNNKWEVVYYTKEIYNYFDDTSRQLYCYKGGYFAKDGDNWREYRPDDKRGIWATYTQYNEEENFYNIKSSACTVSIPKKSSNNFYIYNNNKWEVIYTTSSIYDITAEYDFNFIYNYHKISDNNKMQEVNSPARVSFNRNGQGQISCGGETYKFTFSTIAISTLKNSDHEIGFRIKLTEDKYIQFFDNWCMISNEPDIPFMTFIDLKNMHNIEKVKNLINTKSFFKD